MCIKNSILRNSNLIHCTSESEEKNIKMIDKKIKTKIISHGLDGTDFKKNKIQNRKFRKMLFFSRIHKKKRAFRNYLMLGPY